MKQSIYHRLSSVLWGAIVLMIVLLAVYVSMGRLLTSLTGSFQTEILRELNYRVPFAIDADQVSAEWHSFTPVLVLEGLQVTVPGEAERSVQLSEGRIAVDVAASLLSRSLQMTQVRLNGLELAGELDKDGKLRIRGFDLGDALLEGWVEDFLPSVERIVLGGTHLELGLPQGERRSFDLDLTLSRDGSHRRLEGNLRSSRGMKVFVLGEGVGNPMQPETFVGQLYLDIQALELGAANDLLPDSLRGIRLDGGLGMELWSSWERGKSETSLRLKMNEVVFATRDNAWQIPLDRIALDASLVDRKGGWGLSIAALDVVRGDIQLRVPRLQLDIRGETLNLRTLGLPLAPLSGLLAGIKSLPPAAVDLLQVLQPRGEVQVLKARVADISEPSAGWQLQANFDQLAVEAWRGAPAVTGARGYVELAPGAGFVALDSRQFSIAFPTIYKDPLRYEDCTGTVHISWDEEAVVLSSSLVEALGSEGAVPVLFGLNIPLQQSDVGLEMDLLVGLQGARAIERGKYIPFILNEGLRNWLSESIDEGVIEQGGFLWRGSLTAGSAAQHTVQLFFNIRDTALRYHADWPAVTVANGTVLINDSTVSVWAERASLLDSVVTDLSVEVWVDEAAALWLAIDGSLSGPAADGLAVVNDSPLRQMGGDVFKQWQLTGELETDIGLLLNLSDKSVAPRAEVTARLVGADLDIVPGNLLIRSVNGVLGYASATGFSSRDLAGQLWGRPLQAVVSQRVATAEAGHSAVIVDMSSTVDMEDLQQWLAPDQPAFAIGETAVTAQLVAGSGKPVVLAIDTTLEGVTLELPEPWSKRAEVERPLHLDLSLGAEGPELELALAGDLAAHLALVDNQLRSATVAFGGKPALPEPGKIHISGRMAYADTTQWQQFLARYFEHGVAPLDPRVSASSLAITVNNLLVDRLVAGGRELDRVQLNLTDEGGRWLIRAQTDWLRGELLYVADGESQLDIDYLDLAALNAADPPAGSEATVVEVPAMAVNIADLRWSDIALGELAFDLRSDGADLYAQRIRGQLAALSLRDQTPGRLVWHQGADSRTTLTAKLLFSDLGETLDDIGYQKIIETEEGSFDLTLAWPGGPQDFSALEGEGSLKVDIGKGSFPEAPGGAAGALRVVSIVNLAEIVQRLSLTHMFESGIPFDSVDGEVLIGEGVIEVNRMEVRGGASSFQFSGISEVDTRALDGELVVTLPVANNLSWVAALAAGLPVAAGVFVLSKVFEAPLNRLTSAVYTATGTWDEPVVSFDRVFDDTQHADPESGSSSVQPDSP